MESRGRLENVQELKSNILAFLEHDPEDPTLSGFLNEIALYTDLDSATTDNAVTMMTMHSAKGLEFPWVFVVGMEEGVFPGQRAFGEEEELEEERRLCYVAMTRAREHLTLTNARQRMLFGRTTANAPSRFLEEVPEAEAEWEGRQEPERSFAGAAAGESAWGSFSEETPRSDFRGPRAAERRPVRRGLQSRPTGAAAPKAPLPELKPGDRINHRSFGDGMVTAVTPMGGDALLEVAFDGPGTKKLMLKTAGVHITKL